MELVRKFTQLSYSSVYNERVERVESGTERGTHMARSLKSLWSEGYRQHVRNAREKFGEGMNLVGVAAGLGPELQRSEWEKIVSQPCHYCNRSPRAMGVLHHGIDRMQNDVGYQYGNVVAACARHNYMKGEMGYREFKRECGTVGR